MRLVLAVLVMATAACRKDAPKKEVVTVEEAPIEELEALIASERAGANSANKSVDRPAAAECFAEGDQFVCRLASGELRSFGALLDRPGRGNGECYKACGPGCAGGCETVAVGCVARAGSERVTRALPCFTYRTDGERPRQQDGRVLVVPRKHFRSQPSCAGSVVAGGARLVAVPGATLQVCTHAPCCATHDTCMRFDEGVDWWDCHARGKRACGVSSLRGEPKQAWDLKWFDRDGWPVATAGHCDWSSGAPRWVPPPVTAMELEQAECMVHGRKYPFPGWPPPGTADAVEATLPTSVPAGGP